MSRTIFDLNYRGDVHSAGGAGDNRWLSRVNLVDVYPRKRDPFRGAVSQTPLSAPPASLDYAAAIQANGGVVDEALGSDIYTDWMTVPSQRPFVYQRAINLSFSIGANPVPLVNQPLAIDTIVLDVPSSEATSVFFGFGNGVNVLNGIEVQPGLPIAITPENTREQWEIQRILEAIAAMIAAERNWNPIGKYRAPRVVFNANEYYLIGAAGTTTAASAMLFTVPELQ